MKNFSFEEYILYGALPGLIHKTTRDQKIKLLESLLKTYIEIDIKSLVKEENLSGFNNLLKLLAFNQGQLVEVSNLASEIKCSSPTAQRYLDILEQTFVLYSLQSFSKNLSNELKKSKKYYFYDLGIRNILIKDFKQLDNRKDKGTIYESYVNNFLRSRLKANMSLNFWRTKQQEEIDFILLIDHIPFPIEVKSQLKRPEIPSAFLSFNKHYPDAKDFFLINENIETTIDCGSFQVHFVRIAELEQNELINSILTNP
jgi:hypothetical protein